jgi:GDP-L-fucose synthase
MNKSDTILVTGAGGLVGSHVVELLEAEGYTNVAGLTHKDCDLTNFARTRDIFAGVKPQHVFHAAATVYGIMGNMNNQGRSFLDNTRINCSVIDACEAFGVEKVTVMGTGAVYPAPPKSLPLKESEIFDGRPDPHEAGYGHAKRGMLAMLEAYETSYGLDWAYIVSCNLFGPRDKFDPVNGHVVPALIRKFYFAKKLCTPVDVWGDGSAKRDFLYVKDAARVALLTMDRLKGPVNMGGGLVYSIGSIVQALSEITGVTDIRWDTSKPNGQPYRGYDLTRLNDAGFVPSYSVRQGLEETWEWYVWHHDK